LVLLYVNDINENNNSCIRLFADDCVLYRVIKSPEHHCILQQDLSIILKWIIIWQMKLNVDECVSMICSRSPSYNLQYLRPYSRCAGGTYLPGYQITYVDQCHGNITFSVWLTRQPNYSILLSAHYINVMVILRKQPITPCWNMPQLHGILTNNT